MDSKEENHAEAVRPETKLPMLEFEEQIFTDVFEKDALLIMARGLNYNVIISNLLWVYKDPGNLVLVINSSDHEEKYFMEKFGLSPLPNLGTEREKTYHDGGIHFVSTAVLVVDLLKQRVPICHITGIIVLRAHTVLESCQEAFALRLYRQKNKTGFVKAFSHSPISFTFGYHQVEKVMRALFVTELLLWPRFHGTVIRSLKRRQATVEELHVPMTLNTTQIQACLLDLMNYTLKQLKGINRTLDLQEISTENCLSKKFHKILQSQLDCVWHQLSTRTKEYVQDLKILRGLIVNLIHEDAVSFYAMVSKYRSAEYARVNSGWLLLDSAETLFRLAKGRVYNGKNEFDPEPCPKWKVLSDLLLQEIPDAVAKKDNGDLNKTKILVLCQDNKTCAQLNMYLTMGAGRYLFYTAFRRELTINAIASKYKMYKDTVPSQSKKVTQDSEGKTDGDDDDDELCDEMDKSRYVLTLTQGTQSGKKKKTDESMFEPISQVENLDLTQLEIDKPTVWIQAFKEQGDHFSLERNLQAIRPEYIVMYHSDVAAVRQIEVFECRKRAEEPPCKIYFIMHDQTVEEQTYLSALKREKLAFELLIQTKSVMVVPSYQDGKTDEYFSMNENAEDETLDTRKAGGQNQVKEKPLVVVDIREFRSDLPAMLHKRGINIEPVMISVGDYILTPEFCVERKSISDLIGSLNSGRLYTQCTQMCRNYTRPILLIEFDQNKPFNLQGNLVVSSDMSGADVQQKLQLLTIHFPRLKLVWSAGPYATAELFYELKQGRQNPSVDTAAALSADGAAEDVRHERYNPRPHDMLRRLPGVTTRNVARIATAAGSFDRLAAMTQDEISEIIGNKNDAEALYSILHLKATPADVLCKEERSYKGKYRGKNFRGKPERKT